MITRREIIIEARTWLGTPYKHQGRRKASQGRGGGADCVAIPIAIAAMVGIDVAVFPTNYAREPDEEVLRAYLDDYMIPVLRLPLPGDVLLMKNRSRTHRVVCSTHTAIVVDHGESMNIVHADAGQKLVVEHALDHRWSKRITQVYEVPGVDEWRL